jgi:DNA gyrase/topoisomerase IV subunit A
MSSSKYILDSSKDYSIYVAQSRAIPSVTDGLKDGQRKALWVMRNKGEKVKVVSLSGELIQTGLYLHGDAAASAASSLLAAPFMNNVPLLEGIGTFGTRVAPQSGIGSPRYVYVKKSKAAQQFLYSDLDIVPMKENYDGSTLEPITFLPLIPIVLLNGVSGIAVGWSTDILPRSLKSLKQAVIDVLSGKKISDIPPEYTYLNLDVKRLLGSEWERQNHVWEFSGKIEKEDTSTIRIRELPPGVDFEKFKDKLDKLEEDKVIMSYEDNSTNTIDIEVKFKRGTLKDDFDEDAMLDMLKLRTKMTERIVVLDWNGKSIRQYESTAKLVEDFVEWRFEHYVTRFETILANKEKDLNYIKALIRLFEKKFPEKVLKYDSKKETSDEVPILINPLTLEADEIEKIINIPIYKWTQEYWKKAKAELLELEKEIAYTKDLLDNPKKIRTIFKKEVEAISV